PGEGRDPPLCARDVGRWIPACAGITTWKSRRCGGAASRTVVDLPGEQFLDRGIDKGGVFRVERGIAGAVAPDRWDRPQLGAGHARDLPTVVLDREVEIGLAWHDDRIGGDCAERLAEIAVVQLVGADIGVLPSPQHGQKIVGVAAAEIGFPAADQKILERGEADATPYLLAVEGLTQPPAGIDPAHRVGTANRLRRKPAIL